MTTRPTDQPLLSEAVVQLSPLSKNDSASLLRTIPELETLDEANVETLVQRANGNPFFLEELALASLSGTDPSSGLPDTVHAVISSRIAGLEDKTRTLLYVIAVIGSPAPAKLAAQILGQTIHDLTFMVERLVAMGFLRNDGAGFSVRHMLINDTAYELIAPNDRNRLHHEIASSMESEADTEAVRPEVLAWHFQESGTAERAVFYWIAACRTALRRSAHKEAAVFARNGIRLIETQMPNAAASELELQLCLALALTALSGFAAVDVGTAYSRASELNKIVRSEKASFQVNIGLWLHNWVLGKLSKSFFHAQELLSFSERSENSSLKIQAHASAGEVLVHMGKLAEGLEHLKSGLKYIEQTKPDSIPAQSAAVACASYAGWAASLSGNSKDAERFLAASERINQLMENPFADAIYSGLCSEVFMFEGHVNKCLDLADKAITISREHDFPFWLSTGHILRGWAIGQAGELASALEEMNEGISIFEATGAEIQLVNWYGLKAETLLVAGKFEDGLEAVRFALNYAAQTNDMFFVPRVHAIASKLCSKLGDADQAASHTELAESLVSSFGMKREMIALSNLSK